MELVFCRFSEIELFYFGGTWNVEWSLSFRRLLEGSLAKNFSVKSEE